MKGNICFQLSSEFFSVLTALSEDHDSCVETYLMLIKQKEADKFFIFLRVGNVFLEQEKWGNAQAVFSSACGQSTNSSLAWLGLGISFYRQNKFNEVDSSFFIAD